MISVIHVIVVNQKNIISLIQPKINQIQIEAELQKMLKEPGGKGLRDAPNLSMTDLYGLKKRLIINIRF